MQTIEDFMRRAQPMERGAELFLTDELTITNEQFKMLKRGHIAETMDDKWCYIVKGKTLYAYRTCTGACVMAVDISPGKKRRKTLFGRYDKQYRFGVTGNNGYVIEKLRDFLSYQK